MIAQGSEGLTRGPLYDLRCDKSLLKPALTCADTRPLPRAITRQSQRGARATEPWRALNHIHRYAHRQR